MKKNTILLLIALALFGCDQSSQDTGKSVAVTSPAATTGTVGSKTGTTLETISVASYSYIRVDQQGQEVWLASNPIAVSIGDVVRYSGDNQMIDFYSKSLDRTFPVILFVNQIELAKSDGTGTTPRQNAAAVATNPHANMPIDPVGVQETIEVQALEGGKTIAAIFIEHDQLEGQQVSLRARVTKFSPNILGKNWITLQDGTGTAPDNALVVTSSDTANIGEEVVLKGVVKSNVDIGAGYAYKVILEEVSFSR